jgi:hypothetical protein
MKRSKRYARAHGIHVGTRIEEELHGFFVSG